MSFATALLRGAAAQHDSDRPSTVVVASIDGASAPRGNSPPVGLLALPSCSGDDDDDRDFAVGDDLTARGAIGHAHQRAYKQRDCRRRSPGREPWLPPAKCRATRREMGNSQRPVHYHCGCRAHVALHRASHEARDLARRAFAAVRRA